MIRKIVIVCVAVFLCTGVFGQATAERQAEKSLRKGKWGKAYSQLKEAAAKDSMSIYAAYLLASYFIAPSNPDHQPDSAYHYSQKAIHEFRDATVKQRERLLRQELDSLTLIRQKDQIDSAAFARAKQTNSEESYVHFLTNFSSPNKYTEEASSLRNQAAYLQAEKENTYQSFYDFLTRYPQAEQRIEAKRRYEELLFHTKTSDKRLTSYEQYLIDYPNTAYQREAERNVFEISTASGTTESYSAFLESHSRNFFAKRAKNILFHLTSRDRAEEYRTAYLDSDSLRAVIESGNGYLVPILHNGEFGFMNQLGVEVIKVGQQEISQEYRCGNVAEDVIVLPSKIVAPNGALIWDHSAVSVEDIGFGFITVQDDSCISVLHKSGFKIGNDCVQGAKVLNGKFLALLSDSLWSIWSFNGRMLIPYSWDELSVIKDVMCLKTKDKFVITTMKAISKLADQQPLVLRDSIDEVKPWRNDNVWIKKGNVEGVVNQLLDTVIQADQQHLSRAYFGSLATTQEGIKTIDDSGAESIFFQRVLVQEPWTAVKTDKAWHLYNPTSNLLVSPACDSVSFSGPFAIAFRKDSISIYFSASNVLKVKQPVSLAFIPGQDSSSFLLLEQGDKKSIYSLDGRKLFTVTYDDVQYAGEGFFRVYKRDKKGIVNSAGKILLPLSYDAIGTVKNGVVSLLTAMKFGFYNCTTRKLIKPQYEKNLTVYNPTVLTAYKKGLYGFIGWKNEAISKIEFEEIRFWNDSAAMVRKNNQWMIYEISTNKILMDKIQDYRMICDNQEGKLAIVQQEDRFGVIHSKTGTIIPISFSDIVNVGSSTEPLYFTEKHVEEASIFVVIYYDSTGKMLRREIYEQDEYEKIYCSNN